MATTTTTGVHNLITYTCAVADSSIMSSVATRDDVAELKKAVTARDKHVDDLEADIDFLNEKRHEQEDETIFLIHRVSELERKAKDYELKINDLECILNETQKRVQSLETLTEALRIQVKILVEK